MKNAGQLELFSAAKHQPKKQRDFWSLPPSQRPLVSVHRRVIEELRGIEAAATKRLNHFLIVTNLLRSLRDRSDAGELVSEIYWRAENLLAEDVIAESLGLSIQQLREKVEPILWPMHCVDCECEIDVELRNHTEAQQTRRGELKWRCASCRVKYEEKQRIIQRLPATERAVRSQLLEMPPLGTIQ